MEKIGPSVVFCSIGENCLPHDVLNRKRLPLIATPFSHGRSNVDYVVSLVRENFADLLTPEFLERREVYGKPAIKNIKYTCAYDLFDESVSDYFEFTHHDVIGSEDARASYQRKAERFRAVVLDSSQTVVLLYHHRRASGASLVYVESQLQRLRDIIVSRRGSDNVYIVLFYQEAIQHAGERRLELSGGSGLYVASFFTSRKWEGAEQEVFWGRIDDDLFDQMLAFVTKKVSEGSPLALRCEITTATESGLADTKILKKMVGFFADWWG